MPTVKLKLPPGIYKNGTEYSSAGRWLECDLIRWHSNAIQPIYGWQRRTDQITDALVPPLWSSGAEAVRSGIVISTGSVDVTVILGSNKKVYSVSESNVITDITPTGFTEQNKDGGVGSTGYGMYRYGYGLYGTPRPANQSGWAKVFSWGLAAWGTWPVAVARNVASLPLYIKTNVDTDLTAIATSPTGAADVIVTDERFMMAFGSDADRRRVAWSNREDYTNWTPAVDNQAGGRVLASSGDLVCGIKCLNGVLVLSDNDAFVGSYIGPPFVYGFIPVGTKCGIVGPEAVTTTDTFAVWMGSTSFWIFDGTLRQLPCEILDYYLKDYDPKQRSKTHAFTLSDYSEIWWLYQSKSSTTTEPDSYLIYNYAMEIWYYGRINRTVGLDNDPLLYSLMVAPDGNLWDHDVIGAGFEGRVPFIKSGPLEVANGDRLMGVSYVYPDEQLDGDILMELSVKDMPNEPVRHSEVYQLLQPTSTSGIMGRDIRMKLYSAQINPHWIAGDFRVTPVQGPQS